MFKFLFGIMVGAAGYWAYRFWKGEDDTSWDTPLSSSDQGSSSFPSYTPASSSASGESAAAPESSS